MNMKKTYLLTFSLLIFVLGGCTEEITEENLIGGNWVAIAGFQDGEVVGDPNCSPFEEGIEFKDEDTVFVETHDRDYEYWLYEADNGFEIMFNDTGSGIYSYEISILGENEIGITGKGDFQSEESCYLER
ncbi:hypothetical protein J2Z83_002736 [Virgibacillus natechei]|uniref:Lipocalin-like domain-containing protein n=1 Tax=Virgibacillus natechei TaxID=1216297 RepID=A0ABS4II16_9BACI|nr:hypothetical protein [Virgibacillus natechei]MBP1970600.1 hypothetical protein [Virgibacillus natechei]UZD14005.1 hypothetical protein OLD84_05580 [Virgibacillus natechei]